jgi:hypothetical protein
MLGFLRNRTCPTLRSMYFALVAVSVVMLPQYATAQPAPTAGSIHGFVAVMLPSAQNLAAPSTNASLQPGSSIFVPNIQVTARNLRTSQSSAATVTNPQGYFRTPTLPPGEYRIRLSRPVNTITPCGPRSIDLGSVVNASGEIRTTTTPRKVPSSDSTRREIGTTGVPKIRPTIV